MASTKVIPCISNKAFHILNCAFLILVLMFQSFVLNTFIIWHTGKGDVTSYFWFLGDLLVAGLFVAMTTKSYLYLSQQKALKKEGEKFEPEGIIGKSVFGVLPLCYISWISYATLIVTKIAFIYKSQIVNALKTEDIFGPQLLKFTISSSCIIFMILVAAHHDAEQNSQRSVAIKSMCTNTAFELLDSVSFLSLLVFSESKLIYTYDFENFVLSFACINFFLPTIALYQFSLSDFGQVKRPLDLTGIYHLSHLAFVNIPYLAVRIYLWSGYGSDVSLFIMKNIIAVVWHLKDVVPDFVLLHRQCLELKRGNQQHRQVIATESFANNKEDVELEQI